MIPDIFDVVNGAVAINPNCLLMPELKAVHDFYEDPIPAFSFLYYKFDPKGPYCNVPEEDKDEILLDDFPGDYTLEDDVMITAIEKLSSLVMSPTYRYYLDNKKLIEKLGKFAKDQPITAGRDGNINAMVAMIRNVGKTISEFKQLEKIVQQELDEHRARVRGDRRKAYDQ
jgi:hypothetical protein